MKRKEKQQQNKQEIEREKILVQLDVQHFYKVIVIKRVVLLQDRNRLTSIQSDPCASGSLVPDGLYITD